MVVTNYLDRNEIKYDTGPLRPAEPGSMAIPGLFRPVAFRDKVLIDGGAVNPLHTICCLVLRMLSSSSMCVC
jgi:NTE family protein